MKEHEDLKKEEKIKENKWKIKEPVSLIEIGSFFMFL
jgi:hypothetical protein